MTAVDSDLTDGWNGDWAQLEHAVRSSVAAGAIEAMGWYGDAGSVRNRILDSSPNPSTEADLDATIAIFQSLRSKLPPIIRSSVGVRYFAEESSSLLGSQVAPHPELLIHADLCQTSEEFTDTVKSQMAMGILIDSIDGTTNFRAGIPFFCSAAAVFFKGVPVIGAIHDPTRSVAYTARLRGVGAPLAHRWKIDNGRDEPMNNKPELPDRLHVGFHLSRSNESVRPAGLETYNRLVSAGHTVSMMNSGQLSLALTSAGKIDGFINNATKRWDTAAGHVLVEAAGGKVTNVHGEPIDYTLDEHVSIIAARNPATHDALLELVCTDADPARL